MQVFQRGQNLIYIYWNDSPSMQDFQRMKMDKYWNDSLQMHIFQRGQKMIILE